MKICAKCKKNKSLNEFNKYVRSSDGRQSYCRDCASNLSKEYNKKNKDILAVKRTNWRNSNKENRAKDRIAAKKWRENNPERYKASWKKHNRKFKKNVLLKISNELKCVRCGCDRFEFLEINHKNGGGAQERKNNGSSNMTFYSLILKGERSTTDLEILCKPCNSIHYLELKSGESLPYKLTWGNNE